MTFRRTLAALVTGAMAVIGMAGSVTNLAAFARTGSAHVVTIPGFGDVPLGMWAFVASLDGLVIVMALQVHDRDREELDVAALAVLLSCTVVSAGLQYLAAGWRWEEKTVATGPVVLAGVATAMFFRSVHGGRKAAPSKHGAGHGTDAGADASPSVTAGPVLMFEADASVAPPARGQGTEPPATDSDTADPAALDTEGGPGARHNGVAGPPARDEAHDAIAAHLHGRPASNRAVAAAADELDIRMGTTRVRRLAKAIQAEREQGADHVAS